MATGFPFNMMYREAVAICQKHRVGTIVPEQFYILWNQAQEKIVAQKIQVMEVNKKAYDDLLPLKRAIKNISFTIANDGYSYLIGRYTIPTEYRRILKLSVKLSPTGIPVKTILIKANEATDILNGVYSAPSAHQIYYSIDYVPYSVGPPVVPASRTINIYVPIGTTSATGHIEYYVDPTLVTATDVVDTTLESVFNKEMCDEIIRMTALMYIERVQDPRYQTYINSQQQ